MLFDTWLGLRKSVVFFSPAADYATQNFEPLSLTWYFFLLENINSLNSVMNDGLSNGPSNMMNGATAAHGRSESWMKKI